MTRHPLQPGVGVRNVKVYTESIHRASESNTPFREATLPYPVSPKQQKQGLSNRIIKIQNGENRENWEMCNENMENGKNKENRENGRRMGEEWGGRIRGMGRAWGENGERMGREFGECGEWREFCECGE